jgi:hypothetical protein
VPDELALPADLHQVGDGATRATLVDELGHRLGAAREVTRKAAAPATTGEASPEPRRTGTAPARLAHLAAEVRLVRGDLDCDAGSNG